MKKKYIIIAILCVILVLSLALVACKKDDPKPDPTPGDDGPNHTHTYSKEWSADENYHWHAATCHPDEKTDYAKHQLDANGKCEVCQKPILVESNGFKAYTEQNPNSDKIVLDAPVTPSGTNLVVHYRRLNSAEYKDWGFWIWTAGQEGQCYGIKYQDEFGAVVFFPLKAGQTNARFGLIPIYCPGGDGSTVWADGVWEKDDAGADRFLEPDDYTFDGTNYHVYLLAGDINLYKTAEESNYVSLNYGIKAAFTSRTVIDIHFASSVKKVAVLENGEKIAETDVSNNSSHVSYTMNYDADLSKSYTIKATFVLNNFGADNETDGVGGVDITIFYGLKEFSELFYYEGNDLGATLGENSTTFKVWSPVSTRMVLNLYNEGDGGTAYDHQEMTKGEFGVWEYTANERLAGKYYTYTVYNGQNPKGMEVVDPYAKSAGLNGMRGMVVNFASGLVTPEGWNDVEVKPYDENELVVWETHVADVTSSPTWNGTASKAKTYLGMIEPNTKYTDNGTTVTTGFDHIVELGVNAVQLVPIFDQNNLEEEEYRTFNWGYNPLNYNVLEGSYSSDPTNGYTRIMEFRQLVQAFNEKGINIIMDVVYNHVNEAGSSNFQILMPGYYFRHDATGALSNGSGCGNDTMSERPMFQKFMIDSVTFWAETYKLGGFRFDIMGLHDVETMNKLTQAVRQVNEHIVLYGEAWDSNGQKTNSAEPLAGQSNASMFADRLGQFNDRMRDQIKLFALGQTNQDNQEQRLTDGFKGATTGITSDPYKTLNYVTCHDGYTLYDDIRNRLNFIAPDVEKQALLSQAMVLTSNGISFILAGEEFLRSKRELGGVGEQIHNSYNAPYEVNALDYSRKIKYANVFENYKKLIKLKERFVDDFGLNSQANISSKYSVQHSGNVYIITINTGSGTYVIAHAGPQGGSASALDGCTYDFSTTRTSGISSTLQPYETVVGHK